MHILNAVYRETAKTTIGSKGKSWEFVLDTKILPRK